ncbi:MAG: RES domain-containing protein [Cyclobacteriaceae bacterium]|nr:RES domain-containing protein [Cyclobacteriaceae bacterium]
MILYRCTQSKWWKDLSGQGAFLYGGRWNSKGRHAIYTSESNLLAVLEVAVRIPLTKISADYIMVSIVVPDSPKIFIPKLSKHWNTNKNYAQSVGDNFLKANEFLLMKVPSALMNNTFNYLINPNHKDLNNVKVEKKQPLVFDERLIKMMNQK